MNVFRSGHGLGGNETGIYSGSLSAFLTPHSVPHVHTYTLSTALSIFWKAENASPYNQPDVPLTAKCRRFKIDVEVCLPGIEKTNCIA